MSTEEKLAKAFAASIAEAVKEMRADIDAAVQLRASQAVRGDPRTEELKAVKEDLTHIKQHYMSILAALAESNEAAKIEQQTNHRIVEDLAAIKKSHADVVTIEKNIKMLSTRLSTLDSRISLLEQK